MRPKEILFSVNSYDSDGDIFEPGIFLHFGNTRILVAESAEVFAEIIPHFEAMLDEIQGKPSAERFDPTCRKCGDPLTTEELVCLNCKKKEA